MYSIRRLVTAPGRGPCYLLPIGLMLCWQGVTSIPHIGYYHTHGIADEHSVPVQISTQLSSLNVTALNLAHIPGFFVMAWAWCWALYAGRKPKRAALLALVITAVFGVTNELSQLAVPFRIASPLDMLMNFTGAALAVLLHGKLASALLRETPGR